jgi:phosphoglycerate kinase
MSYLSIRDLNLKGKRVFIRVDFNVPLQKNEQGVMEITSDKRIKASLPTIQYALDHGAGLILASHLGRPKGKPNAEMSLQPVAARLEQLLGRPVKMAPDCVGPQVEAMKPAPGEILLLENLRFHAEEEKNDPAFAQQLAALCDLYVNDAFGSAHRAHASTEGMIKYVPYAAAGLLMEQELKYLGMATTNPPRPCVAILGGAKVSDKIEVIQNLGKVVDRLVIGGAMAYTFLRAQGLPTGKSLVEEDKIELAKELLAKLGDKLLLPVDRRGRAQRSRDHHSRRQDRRGYRARDHRRILPRGGRREDDHLERSHGNLRETAVRQRYRGTGQGRCRIRGGQRSRRRRFREGHQGRRRHLQNLSRLYRRRGIAGVSRRN